MRTRLMLLLLLTTPLTATAQEIENLAGVRLTFDRAGARSLAMGSTAVTSSDLSAAAANPAAIAGASRSFSIEQRRQTMEGRYIGDTDLNTIGIKSTTSGIRSAFLVVPAAGLTWAFSYDEPLDIHHSTTAAFANPGAGAFFVCNGQLASAPCDRPMVLYNLPATYPIKADLRLQRLSVASAWSRGAFAAGVSVRRDHLRQRTAFTSSGIAETIDDNAMTWSAGAMWKLAQTARIGASYSSGGSFAGQRTFSSDPAQSIELRTPPSIGAGFSFDPLPQLTIAADAVRVRYSVMMHERRNVFPAGAEIGYPDVTELHAGAEYRSGRYALRAGWWRDPAHALVSFNGSLPPPPFHYIPMIVSSAENHVTAGIGVGTKTRFDASIDRGSRSTRVALGVSSVF